MSVSKAWQLAPVDVTRDNASKTYEAIVTGEADEAAALTALNGDFPATDGALAKESVSITERLGETTWRGQVRYSLLPPRDVGDSSYSFDTSGGTQHVTQSIATVDSYATSGTAPDYKGAIGATKDSVEGVDIEVPVYSFTETHYLDPSIVTPTYKALIFSLTGCVNNATFKGFAAGECKFLGASGTLQNQNRWEVAFRFAASPNASGLVIGEMTGIVKRGWDYLWVVYEDVEDKTAMRIVRRPIAVYVEQVSPYANLNALGI